MFKGIVIGVLGTGIAALAVACTLVLTGRVPANADARPSALERWAAMTSLHATLAHEAPRGPDPLPATPDNLEAGIRIYAHDCVGCHGAADGRPSPVAKGLYQPPPQLAKHGVEDDPPGYTFWKVEHGIRWTGMPSFGRTLSRDEIWQVALFLQHMDSLPPAAREAWQQVPSVGG